VFFLAGMLLYLRVQDEGRSMRSQRWHLVGFYVCAVLAILSYEQEFTLIIMCALYRLLVLEHRRGFSRADLLARGRVWLREFGAGVVVLSAFLGFKAFVGRLYHYPQAPGLSAGVGPLAQKITIGLYQSYAPGIVNTALIPLQHRLYFGLITSPSAAKLLAHYVIYLAPLVLIILFAKPVYRWLAIWSVIVVVSTIMGIGYLASRYFVLFLVPSSIIWAGALVGMAKWLRGALARYTKERGAGWARAVRALALAPSALVFAVFAVLGLQYLAAQLDNWQQASGIGTVVRHEIRAYAASDPAARKLVLVDLPGVLPAPAGYFEHGAYINWVGTADMVMLTNPGRFPDGIVMYHTNDNIDLFNSSPATAGEVDVLNHEPTTLVLTYDFDTGHMVQWTTRTP
jgi:hypothetical protein